MKQKSKARHVLIKRWEPVKLWFTENQDLTFTDLQIFHLQKTRDNKSSPVISLVWGLQGTFDLTQAQHSKLEFVESTLVCFAFLNFKACFKILNFSGWALQEGERTWRRLALSPRCPPLLTPCPPHPLWSSEVSVLITASWRMRTDIRGWTPSAPSQNPGFTLGPGSSTGPHPLSPDQRRISRMMAGRLAWPIWPSSPRSLRPMRMSTAPSSTSTSPSPPWSSTPAWAPSPVSGATTPFRPSSQQSSQCRRTRNIGRWCSRSKRGMLINNHPALWNSLYCNCVFLQGK